jgi:hypothetical protein
MNSLELTKPITTESLLAEFESRFNQTMDLTKFTKEELEDTANHIRTKIHNITQNTHFGEELSNDGYQKNQMMLDIVNQAIREYNENTILDKTLEPIKAKLKQGAALTPDEREVAAKLISDSELNEVPGAGLIKRGLRSLGAKAAGAVGMRGTAAGLKGAAQADKKARDLYTQLRRYAGQIGIDPKAMKLSDLQSFLQKQGYKLDRTPKGPAGRILDKDAIDQILMKSVQDTFRGSGPKTTSTAKPTAQTDFMKQFQQAIKDPETKKNIIGMLKGQQPVTASAESVVEGVEEQSELILAAKDMMDKVTGYLEDLASMKTEGMLELADRIRDEMGADKADAFLQKIQPAIEQAEATLTTTRQELDNGVRILTGEEVATDTIGADDSMNMDTDLDSLDSEEESDEFGASDAEAGGTEPEGREQRESREVFETSNRIYGKLAGK